MHAVMMTSEPPLSIGTPRLWKFSNPSWIGGSPKASPLRNRGCRANVHVLCLPEALSEVLARLRQFPGVKEVLKGSPAGAAHLLGVDSHSDPQKV